MRVRTSVGNRILSMLLAAVMVLGMLPTSAFAAVTTGDPDVTSNADTILAYAQDMLSENYNKTGAFTWDTEGKSDGWRYFNGVMLEAFLQNGLKVSDTQTAYGFAQKYFSHYINASGNSYNDVLNGEYSNGNKELDGVPPARNLAQLVGHVGFTDTKYANAVKVLYENTIGQDVVSNTGGNFIHKEDNDSWKNWQVGLDGIYMAQPFLMEVAKAVKEGRVNVGDSYTEIADGVYNRLYWIANNMKYETEDGVYLYHHGWGPDGDYADGNGITWSRGTGWWVAGLADCIALMEDIGYNSTKVATLKGYLKEAIDGLLEYQHEDSGLWYNVIYEEGEGTTTSNNFLEISGTGLFAYTIMKACTRGWLTDAKYGQAALDAIDGIMGDSDYYSSGSFKNILKSSGVGTSVSYYNSTKSEDEAKGVGPIIMAASMYDDVKAMVEGDAKYTETFQVGAVNVSELPVMDGVVSAGDLKATVVGSKGTIKDVTNLTTAVDGDKVNVLYEGNVIATVDANIISTDAVTGTGSFTVASSAQDPSTGTKDTDSGTVTVAGAAGDAYVLDEGAFDGAGKYVVVYKASADATTGKALKNPNDGTDGVQGASVDVDIEGKNVTFKSASDADIALCIWTFTASGDGYIVTNTNRRFRNNSSILRGSSDSVVSVKQGNNEGEWRLDLDSDDYVVRSGSNFTRSSSSSAGYNIYLYKLTSGGSGEDVDYTITLTAGSDGELLNKGGTKTLTASLTAAAGETTATPTGTVSWISNNPDVAAVDPSTGEVTAVGAGTAIITATVTGATVSGSEESVDLSVTIPVTVAEADTYNVTLTLTPGAISGQVGGAGSFTPTVVIKDANGTDVTANFENEIGYNGIVDDTSIAEVSNTGVITFKKAGSTTFTQTATVNGITVSATGDILVQAAQTEHTHSYTSAVTKAATCTTAGVRTYTCSCGNTYTEAIPTTGHNYVNGTCTLCGAADPEAPTEETTEAPTEETTVPSGGEVTGNISTGSGDGSVDSSAPSRTESDYVEIKAPSTTTTGGSGTSYTFDPTNDIEDSFFTYPSGDFTSNRNYTYNGVKYTSGVQTDSSGYLEFTPTEDGTLTVYMSSGSAGRTQLLINTSDSNKTIATFTVETANAISEYTVDLEAGNTYRIKQGSYTCYLVYANYTTTGSGSGGTTTTIPGEYAKLVGTQGVAYPLNTGSQTIIAALEESNAFQILIAEDANGTNAAALEDGLGNSRIEITKNASGPEFKMDIANTYYFGVTLDGKKIGEIPVKIYDDTATGTTWYNGTLSLNPTNLNLTVGDAAVNIADSLSAVAVEGGAAATINSFTTTWTSSNNNVATVDSNGNVTAVGAGTATITAKLTAVTVNGETGTIHEEIKAIATVNVTASGSDTPSTPGSIHTHNYTTDGNTDPDGYFTLSGSTGSNSTGVTYNGEKLTKFQKLTSSSGAVSFTAENAGTLILVDGNGAKTVLVNNVEYNYEDGVATIPLEAGSYTVTKGDGETRLYYIEFAEENVAPEYSVTISGNDMLLGGNTTTLTAQMLLGTDNVDGASYAWTVTGAASYEANGNTVSITAANADGDITVSVVATSGGNTAEATHTVDVYPVSASISGANTVYVGENSTYTVAVTPESNYNVTWSVTDGTGSATINASSGVLTGVSAGTVTVTANITDIAGTSIGATASKTVTVADNVYTVTFTDAGINEGVTANLANYVSVTKNGAAMSSGYTLVFTVNGASNGSSYTGEAVDADATHTVGVSLVVDGETVASDTGSLTVYDINFHDTNLWQNVQTNTATVVGGGKLTFTLSGDLAAGYWGFLDNLKLYKANGTQVPITNGDFESGIDGWTVTGFSANPTSDANADANQTNRLALWISDTAAADGTATFTVTGLDAGDYYFTYDLLNGASGSSVTGTATATEAVKSNVSVTTSASDGNVYKIATSYETGVPYVIGRFNSSYGMGAFPSASGQKMVAVYTLSNYGEDLNATYTMETAYHYYIDSEGRVYYQNNSGTKYYVQFTEASSSGLKLTTTEGDASKFTISINSDGVATFRTTVGSSTRYLQVDSGGGKTNSGAKEVVLYQLVSAGGNGETTEYLVDATAQNLTVEAGSSVDPVITLTGVDMDGNTVTVTGSWDMASANTGIATIDNGKVKGVSAGTTTVTATLKNVKVNGYAGEITVDAITATFNVTVTPAPVSKDEWIHNVTDEGVTDSDNFYDISKDGGKASTSDTSRTYDGMSFDTAIKMETETQVEFTAPYDGTFTMIFRTSDAGRRININGTSHTIASDGTLTIDVTGGTEYTVTKDDSVCFFYMEYASALQDGITVTEPGRIYMCVPGAANGTATHTMEYTVRHGEQDVTANTSAYTIAWSSDNETVARINATTGVITGIKSGTANITATVTMTDGTQYTATVPVTVDGPSIGTTDELNLMVDVDRLKTGTIDSNVVAAGQITNDVVLGCLSSDPSVATVEIVDGKPVVTAVGVGTATIYTYVTEVNGHTVYSGTPTVDNLPNLVDSTAVTVSRKEVTDAHLNSYDYIIQKNADGSLDALVALLEYKADVVGAIHGEEGIHLTVKFNTGDADTIEVKPADLTLTGTTASYTDANGTLSINLSLVDMTTPDIYTAVVIYTDAKGNELFRDTIWIHVEEYNPAGYDGTMTWEGNVSYELDTDGIDPNEEYVIVADRNLSAGTGIAFMNPDVLSNVSSAAASNSVAIKTENGEEILTMASGNEGSDWLFDTYVLGVNCPDRVVRTQLNISNSLSYVGPGDAETQLIHGNVAHVYLETVDSDAGAYRIVMGFTDSGAPMYLAYENGVWHATTTAQTLYLYNKHADVQDYGVNYDLYNKDKTAILTETELIEGYVYEVVEPVITWGGSNTAAESYTIVWSSDNENVATVDQNGKVTAVAPGTATITATLYHVNGFAVICNIHNTEYLTKSVVFEITESDAHPELKPNVLTIGQGSLPNFAKVDIMMVFGDGSEYDYPVDHNLLEFKLADATGVAADGTVMDRFDNMTVGTYTVPVVYGGDTYDLTIHVVEDPYAGLDKADSIPGYPDAGSVRMNKTADGVLDFTATGVTKIELNAAGVSTKSSVDVLLIVDVSNSMGWSIDWFEDMTNDEIEKADDYDKGPADGASGTDKLDIAMATADDFADILLNVEGGDNTITFVTFAGSNSSGDNIDSVRTPMVGVSKYSEAAEVFAATKFTDVRYLDGNSEKGSYKLTIGSHSSGDDSVSGSNRGNTNYDFAFGEAMDAIAALKAQYAANNDGKSYDDSGRQIQVVFMTDGAPSHYNGKKATGSADTLWSGSGSYSTLSDVNESKWLAHAENYNVLATELYAQTDGFYVVGFDMAHGGFGDYSYTEDQMDRVLRGLVMNTSLPVTLASDEDALSTYFTNLAKALAYAGTNARVTDQIGGSFSLFSGAHMYSSDITDGGIMSEDTLAAMEAMSFPITVSSHRLVTAADMNKTLEIIQANGTTATVTVNESHLGLRVAGEDAVDVLETIHFTVDGNGTLGAYSSVWGPEQPILVDDYDAMTRTIYANTFTYTATLSTVTDEDGNVTGYHADEENIQWKIGNITDREVSMTYYAYLEGSLDNPRVADAGVYATNNYAYLEYIDVYGKYVNREYGVPQVAWGAGSVTVRFFLVNANGQYVNRAGVPFTNPANRIFLDGRAHYEAELNSFVDFNAQDALAQAGLAGSNNLYDITAGATVANSTEKGQGYVTWVKNSGLTNINNLLTYTDSSNGYYTNVVIDIPVVMTSLGQSLLPMAATTVVADYGKPMDISMFSAEEMPYVTGYADVRNPDQDGTKYWYTMEVVGFANYSKGVDLRDYIKAGAYTATLNTANGSYAVTSANGATQVQFTPNGIMEGMDQVFVAIAFQEYAAIANGDGTYSKGEINPDGVYYMYKQLNVIPATVVYYEAEASNIAADFAIEGDYTLAEQGNKGESVQDVYTAGGTYGYDSGYTTDNMLSGGAAYKLSGAGVDTTKATFSFTGTGFDIISRTGPSQGAIRVTYTNNATKVSKVISVINKGYNELYQNPVISIEGLTYGTYTVEIGVYPAVSYGIPALDRGNEFYLDAVRIYGTMKGTETFNEAVMEDEKYTTVTHTVDDIYTADGENSPVFTEIRDILINAESFASTGEGAMFLDDFDGEVSISTYKSDGANNETYLKPGQAIAFTFSLSEVNKSFDLGLRAVDGTAATAKVAIVAGGTTYEKTVTLGSATSQFYDLLATTGFSGTGSIHVVISNTSGGILCLTDLKYNGSAAIASDYQTYLAAAMTLSDEYDVYSAQFAEDRVRIARNATMTVVTSTEVESLVITNCYGEEVWFSATSQDVGSQRIWTVKLRPVLQGEQSFTVTGCAEDGTTGASASDTIVVELY